MMTEEERNEQIKKLSKEAEAFLICDDVENYYRLKAEITKIQYLARREKSHGRK